MPTIKTPVRLVRKAEGAGLPASSSIISAQCEISFTKAEKTLDLRCFVKAALFERDRQRDKVFFWTNGSHAHAHSWIQSSSDTAKDDFIGFFPSVVVKPSDSKVLDGVLSYDVDLDLNDPRLADAIKNANDTDTTPGSGLVSDNLEELRVIIHAYNELAPSTAMSGRELEMNIL